MGAVAVLHILGNIAAQCHHILDAGGFDLRDLLPHALFGGGYAGEMG